MYPPAIGSHPMRSSTVLPTGVRCFPAYLREAGYYTTNNSKTDYNFSAPKDTWDESSGKAHFKNRPEGKPFFAVFNFTVTHESQIRAGDKAYEKNTARLTPEQRHDPTKAVIPPYYPDTPIVRKDWARYHDNITAMDYQVADLLKELDEAGLADDTIVFFYSDHGRGLPRGKRWLYDSSVHVPLLVRYPEKLRPPEWKAGTTNDELVAFVDLAPTVLSLAGIQVPKIMQGRPFLGGQKPDEPRKHVYGCRDRMDERTDMSRSVRDKQFKYIRNYQWWKPYAQHLNYAEAMPTMQELRRLKAEGKLNQAQAAFMADRKPIEELYDLAKDPHEINNLAGNPAYQETLDRLRGQHEAWTDFILDTGYVPESLLIGIRELLGSSWRDVPQMAKTAKYLRKVQIDLEQEIVAQSDTEKVVERIGQEMKAIGEDAGPFRLLGMMMRFADLLPEMKDGKKLMAEYVTIGEEFKEYRDPVFLPVRLSLASAMVRVGRDKTGKVDQATIEKIRPLLIEGLTSKNPIHRHDAVQVIDDLGPQAVEFIDEIRTMLKIDDAYAARIGEWIIQSRGKK
jgi:arylsulfatase A-like enzyme